MEKNEMQDPRDTNRYSYKQENFCIAYTGIAKGDATYAAGEAGYSGNKKALAQRGFQNLQQEKTKLLIKYLSIETRNRLSCADIYEKWYDIANDKTMYKDNPSVVSKTLSDNAKANGMFIDKIDISVDVQLKDASKTIKLLTETFAFAMTHMGKVQKDEIMDYMEKRKNKLNEEEKENK